MSHYHDSEDLKVLGDFKNLAGPEFKGFVEFDKVRHDPDFKAVVGDARFAAVNP